MLGGNGFEKLMLKDWMLHRSSLVLSEHQDYMKWKMLRSSLEIYAPLAEKPDYQFGEVNNLAQSFSTVKINPAISIQLITKGFEKYP